MSGDETSEDETSTNWRRGENVQLPTYGSD